MTEKSAVVSFLILPIKKCFPLLKYTRRAGHVRPELAEALHADRIRARQSARRVQPDLERSEFVVWIPKSSHLPASSFEKAIFEHLTSVYKSYYVVSYEKSCAEDPLCPRNKRSTSGCAFKIVCQVVRNLCGSL